MNTGRRYHWSPEQKQLMVSLYEDDEWSIQEIADRLGCNRETVRFHLRKQGVHFRGTGMRTARARAKWTGAKHGNWKGGRQKNHGYVSLHRPGHPHANRDKTVPEHRLVMEDHLRQHDPNHPALVGEFLSKEWVVHHING